MAALTEAQLQDRFRLYGPRDWDQACQAAIRQACAWTGGAPQPNYLSAIAAYRASRIISTDPKTAPLGAVHYWAIGQYGHVAGALGGGRVFMASKYIQKRWATNIGTTTVAAYTRTTGARYLGWARTNGHNTLLLRAPGPAAPPRPVTGRKYTTARPGEGFIAIAKRVGVSTATLERLNPKVDPSGVGLRQRIYYS